MGGSTGGRNHAIGGGRRRQRRKRKTNFISANAYRVNAVQFRRLLVRRRRVAGTEGRRGGAPHKLASTPALGWV